MSNDPDQIPIALCCCGSPLVGTMEVPAKEWYCVTCEQFFEWMHARRGNGPNPPAELNERCQAAEKQYKAERAARRAKSVTA